MPKVTEMEMMMALHTWTRTGVRLVACVAAAFVLVSCSGGVSGPDPDDLAEELAELDSTRAAVNSAKQEMSTLLGEATAYLNDEELANSVPTEEIEHLQSVVSEAEGILDSLQLPAVPVDLASIAAQRDDLTELTAELEEQVLRLEAAMAPLAPVYEAIEAERERIAQEEAAEKARLEEERERERVANLSPNATYEVVLTNGTGNKQRVTVEIGKWIAGSNAADLEEAWANVGGRAPMPLVPGTYSTGGFAGVSAKFVGEGSAAYVFGTVAFENLTPEFPSSNFGVAWLTLEPRIYDPDGWWVKSRLPAYHGMGDSLVCVQYSTPSCMIHASEPTVKPALESDKWGPVPFVIAVDHVFTPNHPDGHPEFYDIGFVLGGNISVKTEGDTNFTVEHTW